MPRVYTTKPTLARLDEHIEKDDQGCWLWTAATRTGYGTTHIGSRTSGDRRQVMVHRLTYELLVGPIPEGLDLDHLCRVRRCVNPFHLEPVTRRENLLRGEGLTASKAAQTHCIHGHAFTPRNTRIRKNGTRTCVACARDRQRTAYARAALRKAQARLASRRDACP